MKITRNNYEEFFLDYHEGNLSEELKGEVLLFLEANPDLKEEFYSFEAVQLEQPQDFFAEKDLLKKETINKHNYQNYFIAHFENDLSKEEKKDVETFIAQHPETKSEFELYNKTKLVADTKVVFKNKSSLKKGGRVIPFAPATLRYVAIAASVLLVFVFGYFLMNDNNTTNIAETNHTSPLPEKNKKENSVAPQIASTEKNVPASSSAEKIISPVQKTTTAKHNEQKAPQSALTVHEEKTSVTPTDSNPTAENKSPQISFTINDNQPKGVAVPDSLKKKYAAFSDDELAELSAPNKVEEPSALGTVVNGAGKLLDKKISYTNSFDKESNRSLTALAIGKFEISRSASR